MDFLSYFNIFDIYLDESLSWILSQFINNQNKDTMKLLEAENTEVWRPGHRLKSAKDSHNGAMCHVNLMHLLVWGFCWWYFFNGLKKRN